MKNEDQERYLNAKDLVEDDGPHADLDPVSPKDDYNDLVDCLQVAGVDAIDAVRYAASIRPSGKQSTSMVEMYGAGRMCSAANARRRSLNTKGLGPST